MTKPLIDELLVSAVRAEPMDVEERRRLDRALAGSSRLQAARHAQVELGRELSALRAALAQRASPVRADAPRALLRAHARRRDGAARGWRAHGLAAAFAVVVIGAALLLVAQRGPGGVSGEGPTEATVVLTASAATDDAAHAFQPLMFAPAFSPSGAYRIVRVRLPLSALALYSGMELDGVIEADLLIGEDGLASGIRFDAETLHLVAAVDTPGGID